MSRGLEKRLERLEARNAGGEREPAATDDEMAALAYLWHVLRPEQPGRRDAPVTDAEWAELQRAGLVT